MIQNVKNKLAKLALFTILGTALSVFGLANPVQAATLGISPSNVSVRPGQTFTVNVSVSSTDQSANAVSGTVTFPSNLVEITSISKSGSVITLWAEEPTFSNSAGTASFEGVILNPGFSGSAGRVVSINMRAKSGGTGTIRFSSSAVLANDGRGTNILTGTGSSQLTVAEAGATEETPQPTESNALPGAVSVSSSTHPDSTKWYKPNTVQFSWSNPSGTTGVNILGDQSPETDPGNTSDGNFNTYSYEDVEDGTWYFHIKVRNSRGWGPVSHFRFNIDSQAPTELVVDQTWQDEPGKASFKVKASDATSGIGEIEVAINGGEPTRYPYTENFVFTTGVLPAGEQKMVVKAFDLAGNEISKDVVFSIAPHDEDVREVVTGQSFVEFWSQQWDKVNKPWVWIILLLIIAAWIIKYMPVEWFTWISHVSGHGRVNHHIYREMTRVQMNLVSQISLLEGARQKRKLSKEEAKVLSAVKEMLLEVDEMLIDYVRLNRKGRK